MRDPTQETHKSERERERKGERKAQKRSRILAKSLSLSSCLGSCSSSGWGGACAFYTKHHQQQTRGEKEGDSIIMGQQLNDDGGHPMVAVAIDRDKSSQNALKWALENLIVRGQTITLVHVNTQGLISPPTPPKQKHTIITQCCFYPFL